MLRKFLPFLLFILICACANVCNAQQASSMVKWEIHNFSEHKVFIENQGQFDLPGGNTPVLFAAVNGGAKIYFTQSGIVYSLIKKTVKKNSEENRVSEESKEEEKKNTIDIQQDQLSMTWVDANPDAKIITEDMAPDYYSYTIKTGEGDKNINYVKAYKKLIYKNLYPSIDVEYVFHEGTGIEYSLILHPGADISTVKMQYSNGHRVSITNGNIHISTTFGDIIDYTPTTFYSLNNHKVISSRFAQNGNTISFVLGDYDHSSDITIDPWTITPTFPTSNKVWNVQTDGSGNVYMYGGDSPVELQKYSSTGSIIWTYNTPWSSASYWTGTLITDRTGNSYITAGSSAEMSAVNSAGAVVWHKVPSSTDEYWHESFNCDQTQLIVGGTALPSGYVFNINPANGAVVNSLKVGVMVGGNPDEARSICSAPNGNYYFLTLDSIGSVNSTVTSVNYKTNNSYKFAYLGPEYANSSGSSGNMGLNAMRATKNYLYTVNGAKIDQRGIGSLAVLATAAIPGGSLTSSFGVNAPNNGGIDIDSCSNIYVGGIKKVTEFTAGLTIVSTVSAPDTVYDIAVNNNGEVIACGNGFAMSINFSACKPPTPICKPCTNPTITKSVTDLKCNGANNGSAKVSVTSGGGPFYYNWSSITDTTATANNLAAGIYSVTVTNSGGCSIIDTVKITQPSPITIGVTTAPSCAASNGTATAVVSGGTGPFTYNWTPSGGTNGTATGLAPGNYTVSVTDKNGCPQTQTATISSSSGTAPTVTMTFGAASCGSCNGTATATPTPAGSYSYIWSNGDTTKTVNNICSGTYTVTVTPNSGSSTSVFYTENFSTGGSGWTLNTKGPTKNGKHQNLWKIDNQSPLCTSGGNYLHVGCSSSDFSFTCNPGATYDPGNPVTDNSRTDKYAYSPVISTVGKTNMVLTFIYQCNGGGSPVTDYGKLALYNGTTWTDLPTAYSGVTSCTKATVNIPAAYNGLTNFQYGFRWVNSDSGNGVDPPFAIDSISIKATSSTPGCPTVQNVTVTSAGSFSLTGAPTNASCGSNNGSATANPSPAGAYTYKWSDGQTTQTATGLAAGSYTVIVSAGACSDTAIVTVANSGGPSVTSTITDPKCNGNTGTAVANVTGGVSPYTYNWSPSGGTNATANGLAAGSYTCTITDKNGCISLDTITVKQPAAITANTSGTTPANCGSSNGTASVTASGGTGALTYSWAPSGGTNATANNLVAGSYTCTVTDANGCSKTTIASVSNTGGPTSTIASTSPKCNGGTGSAIASITTGTGPFSYTWTPACTHFDSSATNLSAGTYTCTVTDKNGCITNDTVTINQPIAITGTTNITNASCGASNGSVILTASGGTGAFTYSWNSGQTTSSVNNLPAGSYTCTVTDANGCPKQITALINNIGAPTITTSQNNEQCFGDNNGSATVNASGGTSPYTYSWSPSGGTNATATNLGAGTYTCVITDSKGCITDDTVKINQPTALTSTVTPVAASCGKPGTATVAPNGGTGPYTYSWSPTGGTGATASGLAAGNYTCTVTDANGCKQLLNTAITGNAGPIVSISSDTIINSGASVNIFATGGGTYLWSPSTGLGCNTCSTTTADPTKNTTYCVLVTDSTGCADSTCMTIDVILPCGNIFVPDAFSPNGDHENDLECVYGGCIETINFSIFDRWGNKVFETTDPLNNCWDGKYKGQIMNTGIFVYYLNAVLTNGSTVTKKGNITLVR
jgi:gliding motility-associated-like protein